MRMVIAPLVGAVLGAAVPPGIAVTNTVPPSVPGSPQPVPTIVVSAVPPPVPPSIRGPQAVRPAQSYVTPLDYPAAARDSGAQGTVRFTLTVDAAGHVVLCTITGSSGSAVLDRASCNLIRRRARFTPAMNSNGMPVAGNIEQEVSWALPRDR